MSPGNIFFHQNTYMSLTADLCTMLFCIKSQFKQIISGHYKPDSIWLGQAFKNVLREQIWYRCPQETLLFKKSLKMYVKHMEHSGIEMPYLWNKEKTLATLKD